MYSLRMLSCAALLVAACHRPATNVCTGSCVQPSGGDGGTNGVGSDGGTSGDGSDGGTSGVAGDGGTNGDGGTGCADGATDTQPCGNCGTMQRACVGGAWQPFGACSGEGECAPGASDSAACGTSVGACRPGSETRTCSTSCTWSAFGTCGGSYVGPTAEVCGDGIDNNCNGAVDEGCDCHPVAAGAGSAIALGGTIVKMIGEAGVCRVYALDASATPHLVVVDTSAKSVAASIVLPATPSDVDLSPDGKYLVISYPATRQITVIDKSKWTIATTLTLPAVPQTLEVGNLGLVYYNTGDQWTDTHRVDLATGASSDTIVGTRNDYAPDIELSSDGKSIYAGGSANSGADINRWALGSGSEVAADTGTWDQGYGFPFPERWVYLAPNGKHVYYAGHQFDATMLTHTGVEVDEKIFAEDTAGTFAVGEKNVIDAVLGVPVATLAHQAAAAALSASDRELWYWSAGSLYYQNVDDFLVGIPLAERARPAAPLSSYSFVKLAADPVRDRVYGIDADKQLLVAIDLKTQTATGAIVVGSKPNALSVSPSGKTLWIGHEGMLALAKIDLVAWKFDGFAWVPIDSYDVAAIGDKYVAAIDGDQWTNPTLLDANTGAVLDSIHWAAYEGALFAPNDGKTLFVSNTGDGTMPGEGNVTRYDVSSGKLVVAGNTGVSTTGAVHMLAGSADGSLLVFGTVPIDGTTMKEATYRMPRGILTVTNDERLAISADQIFDAGNGGSLYLFPGLYGVQAASPDGKTLYVIDQNVFRTIDLTKY